MLGRMSGGAGDALKEKGGLVQEEILVYDCICLPATPDSTQGRLRERPATITSGIADVWLVLSRGRFIRSIVVDRSRMGHNRQISKGVPRVLRPTAHQCIALNAQRPDNIQETKRAYSFALTGPSLSLFSPSSHQTTVTVKSSLNLLECGARIDTYWFNFLSSAPPSAFRIKCVPTFESTNAHPGPLSFDEEEGLLALPSIPIAPGVSTTVLASLDFGMGGDEGERGVPEGAVRLRYSPTRATTSAEERRSQRPSVAKTRKRMLDEGDGVSLRCVISGREVTYGGVLRSAGALLIERPSLPLKSCWSLRKAIPG